MSSSVPRTRDDLVGKRFLCVPVGTKLKLTRASDWPWKSGLIRCSSLLDTKDPDLQILVEFDHLDWEKREWLIIRKEIFHIFLVEEALSIVPRSGPNLSGAPGTLHPALCFKPLVDNVGFWKSKHPKPVEFLNDLKLEYLDYSKLKYIKHWDPTVPDLNLSDASERCVRAWTELQDGQHILITTPSVLLGFRLKVYRAEGTTQWYTAVTTGYNEASNEFTLTDDTVLEEHYEDPRLTQMKLLGEGVVESILKGENVGITPRRSRSGQVSNLPQPSSANTQSGTPSNSTSRPSPSSNRGGPQSSLLKKPGAVSTPIASPAESTGGKKSGAASQNNKTQGKGTPTASASSSPAKESPPSSPTEGSSRGSKRGRGRPPVTPAKKEVAVSAKPKIGKGIVKKIEEIKVRGRHKKDTSESSRTVDASVGVGPPKISSSHSSGSTSSSEDSQPTSRPLILSNRKEGKGKRKAIAIVRPQQHVRENPSLEKQNTEHELQDHNSEVQPTKQTEEKKQQGKPIGQSRDREARFSLYDFPSDSETEDKFAGPNSGEKKTASVPGSPVPANRNPNKKSIQLQTASSSNKRIQDLDIKKPPLFRPTKSPAGGTLPSLSESSDSLNSSATATQPSDQTNTQSESPSADPNPSSNPATTNPSQEAGDIEFSRPAAAEFLSPASQNNDPPSSVRVPGGSAMQHLQSHPMGSQHHSEELANSGGGSGSRDPRGDDNRSTDSGVSTIRSVSGEERSGSRSSTVSDDRNNRSYLPESSSSASTSPPTSSHLHSSSSGGTRTTSSAAPSPAVWRDPTLLALHQARSLAISKVNPHQSQAAALHASTMAEHARKQNASGSPGAAPQTIHMAAAAAMQFSAMQQYQAAIQAATLGVQTHHTANLLANLPPEMLLKQFPHLATGIPPQLLAQNRGSSGLAASHAELLLARDIEIRERREAEQRERDRLEKERAEKDRRDREQRERERREAERRERERHEQRQKLSAVEAVDHHFQMSMELAKKRAAQQWPQMGGTRSMGPSHEEERRRFESEQQRRAQEEARHYLNLAARTNAAQVANNPSMLHRAQQPAHQSGQNNNKPGQGYPTSAASIHYPGARGPPLAHPKSDPGPPPPLVRTNGSALNAHHMTSPGQKHPMQHPGNSDPKYPLGFKPYEAYPARSSSTSPSLSYPSMSNSGRQPQAGRPSPGLERPAHSPHYSTSSLPPPTAQRPPIGVSPNQLYIKPAGAHPTSQPLAPPPSMAHSGIAQTPPPAHGGSSRHHAIRTVSKVDLVPNHHHPMLHPVPSRHSPMEIVPAPAHISQTDQPLDLGLATKRRAEGSDDLCGPEVAVSPKKLLKIEPNAQLFKVSEPSVLPPSEPSIITTVINSALTSVAPPMASNDSIPETHSETSSTVKDECEEGGGEQVFGYVHKLKKAWIKSYSGDPTPSGGSSNPATPPLAQQQSSSTRASPSPALSNKSESNSVASSQGISRNVARVTGAKHLNGHSTSGNKKVEEITSSESEADDDDSQTYSSGTRQPGKKSGTAGRGNKGTKQFKSRGSKGNRVPRSATASSADSDKDSDISTATSRKSGQNNSASNRKRGRTGGRGGGSGRNSSVTNSPSRSSSKKSKDESASLSSSSTTSEVSKISKKKKPSLAQLKKTGQSFLQDASCFEVAPKLAKCRECRWTQSQRNKKMPNIFCRFYAFRRVRYAKNGQLCVAGFCDPKRDVTQEDMGLWITSADSAHNNLNDDQSYFLIENLRIEFETLLKQERQAIKAHSGEENVIAWKRVVHGVREMCDVCDANLFNFHWACGKCGFVVCLDCYVDRKNDVVRNWGGQDRDKYSWLLCTNRTQHEISRLMLTQIIAGDALEKVADRLKEQSKPIGKLQLHNGVIKKESDSTHLRDLIGSDQTVRMSDIIDQAVEDSMEDKRTVVRIPLRHFVRMDSSENDKPAKSEEGYVWRHGLAPPVKTYTSGETKPLYAGVQHMWLSNGKVLRLESPPNEDKKVIELFQEVWRRGQPIVVGHATRKMNLNLWDPSKLNSEFGSVAVELINIQTGDNLPGNHSLKKFWEGFSNVSKRLRDEDGEPALLKLRDWPSPGNSGEEFSETLPQHSANILAGLPLPAYTDRGVAGLFNLAANLPDVFVRPDLGPRSFISYGDSQSPECGTYNLRLELADTLWIMVRAETPSDLDKPEYKNQVIRTLDFVGCNEAEQKRAADGGDALPGGLWHVFHPSHADSIRDLLNREAAEKRAKAKRMLTKKSRAALAANSAQDSNDDQDGESDDKDHPNFDPIHEEATYLTRELLKKLEDDYGIVPFVFTVFEGEAVVIPAGAPFQVKYLQSCISVCVNFVSPENLSHSCQMVRQFRHLPEGQLPAPEDRFLLKNLVFHSVKRALASKKQESKKTKIKTETK